MGEEKKEEEEGEQEQKGNEELEEEYPQQQEAESAANGLTEDNSNADEDESSREGNFEEVDGENVDDELEVRRLPHSGLVASSYSILISFLTCHNVDQHAYTDT
jgi:hypothetical protein